MTVLTTFFELRCVSAEARGGAFRKLTQRAEANSLMPSTSTLVATVLRLVPEISLSRR